MTDFHESASENAAGSRVGCSDADRPILIQLPPELAQAIDQRMAQLGQTQTQAILEVLQVGLRQAPSQATHQLTPPALPDAITQPFLQEFEHLKRRLSDLEVLIPRMEGLEGKLIAF